MALRVMTKKTKIDPIQSAIVNENVLSLMGVCMPIATSLLCYLTGASWVDLVGEMLNGGVQVYLGVVIFTENAKILVGQSLAKAEADKVRYILEDREEVDSVETLKTEYLSNTSFKISATIRYDSEEISDNITEVLETDIQAITSDPQKQKAIRMLISKSTELVLTHTTEIIREMEADVQKEFPHVREIDLEQSKTNISKDYKGLIPLDSEEEEEVPSK